MLRWWMDVYVKVHVKQMVLMYSDHFVLYWTLLHNWSLFDYDILQTIRELSEEYKTELAKSPYREPSRHAAFAYDAVWTIALTLNQSISALKKQNETRNMSLEDFDYTNTAMRKTFMKTAKGISFQGMSVSVLPIFSLVALQSNFFLHTFPQCRHLSPYSTCFSYVPVWYVSAFFRRLYNFFYL